MPQQAMNCIIIEDYEESRKLVEIFVEKTRMLNLIGSYESAVEAINDQEQKLKVDLVLLDIELPEMSGMEYLRTLETNPVVIILSAQESLTQDFIWLYREHIPGGGKIRIYRKPRRRYLLEKDRVL